MRIARSEPQTPEAIRTYLEDVGASAIAAANQYTDPETAAVAYEEMTGRVLEDLRLGLPLDMAVTHQQYRELGYRNIGFSQPLDGSEVAVHFS